MTGSIDECYLLSVTIDVKCTNFLSDAADFALSYGGTSEIVNQSGLSVIDVSHDGDNR